MLNVRRPAYSGIIPSDIKWKSLIQEEKLLFRRYFDCNVVETLQKKDDEYSTHLVGYYRSTSHKKNFIKILDKTDNQSQLQAEKIASWLKKNGICTSCAIDGYPKEIEEHDLWIYAYDYIEHCFFSGSKYSIYLLGKELRKIHILMQKYPDIKQISFKGKNKNDFLLRQLYNIKTGLHPKFFPKIAIEIIKRTTYDELSSITQHGQAVHGDMNLGNVIFQKNCSYPIFIDFEDATTAWLSPLYDLAFIIQRFILLNDVQEKIELSSCLLSGYCFQNNPNLKNIIINGSLYSFLKMISIRSLLSLSVLPDIKQGQYVGEVSKFVKLYKNMEDNMDLIYKIEKSIKQIV
jgi:hypothetical protein